MRSLTLIFVLMAQALSAAGALDLPAPAEDWRTARELQQRTQGAPELPPLPGSSGELALGLAELGVQPGKAQWKDEDYDALYSLLQRYRDQLLGLGVDVESLQARLKTTQIQAQDLGHRLDSLLPVDGAKIRGRLRTSLEDLHVVGAKAWTFSNNATGTTGPSPQIANKGAGTGVRHQVGVMMAELDFDMTRGPFSGLVEFGVGALWGGTPEFGLRRYKGELRLPVAIQVGTLDLALSPLTLWRNEDAYPFEPEPFSSRRERIRRDYQLEPHRWRLSAVRLSTDLRLFGAVSLELESITGIPALGAFDGTNNNLPVSFLYRFPTSGDQLMATNNTLLEGWRLGMPLGPVTLSYNGNYQTTVTESRPLSQYRQMQSLVQSGRLEFKQGIFRADIEGASSGFVAATPAAAAEVQPLYGSAYRALVSLEGESWALNLQGRSVDRRFHSAGAQGRTQDRNYELLGPLGTEVSHVGPDGRLGIANGASTPLPPQVQWNATFIPAGVWSRIGGNSGNLRTAGTFSHLLPYTFLAALSPYGDATPNRQGGSLEGSLKLFDKALQPMIRYEMANQQEVANDPALESYNGQITYTGYANLLPFTLQKAQGGLRSEFTLGIPFEAVAGATWLDIRNGQNSPLLSLAGQPLPFALTALLTEAGLSFSPFEKTWVCVGWRHLEASGVSDKETVSRGGIVAWDQMGYGIKAQVAQGVRMDLLWETMNLTSVDTPSDNFGLENAYVRMTVDF